MLDEVVSSVERVAAEIKELEALAGRTASGQRGWAAWWRFIEMWMGLAVAVLSALAGVVILTADSRTVAAVLSLSAAGMSAVLGFTRPADKARKAEMLALRCDEFERRARYERLLAVVELDAKGARSRLVDIAERWHQIRWDDLHNRLENGSPSEGQKEKRRSHVGRAEQPQRTAGDTPAGDE